MVDVAVDVIDILPDDNMSPPVMVNPVADDKPPVVETLTPPVNVEVADSVTSKAPAKVLLVVDVAVMNENLACPSTVSSPILAGPLTDKSEPGVDVAMPIFSLKVLNKVPAE